MSSIPEYMMTGVKVQDIQRRVDGIAFHNAQQELPATLEMMKELQVHLLATYTMSELMVLKDALDEVVPCE
jgi:hypothetical protein